MKCVLRDLVLLFPFISAQGIEDVARGHSADIVVIVADDDGSFSVVGIDTAHHFELNFNDSVYGPSPAVVTMSITGPINVVLFVPLAVVSRALRACGLERECGINSGKNCAHGAIPLVRCFSALVAAVDPTG